MPNRILKRSCTAQQERIVITRAGKPSAVVVGIESYDAEDLQLATSLEFWKMIQERRRGPEISLSQLKSRLGMKERSRRSGKARPSSPKKKTNRNSSRSES
jgi:PHD/YefM family antitoxin component YafN of YafNO toxin-antitoxin module